MVVVHMSVAEGLSPVYHAQVARPMISYRNAGYTVRLLTTSPIGDYIRTSSRERWRLRQHELQSRHGLQLERLLSPPSRFAGLLPIGGALSRWLKHNVALDAELTFHCRGPKATILALDAVRGRDMSRVIYDCRGFVGDEYAYVRGYNSMHAAPESVSARAFAIHRLELDAAARCNAMICVSHAMKEKVVADWAIEASKVAVVPCCTDVSGVANAFFMRDRVRTQLQLDDKFVVAYCGSLESWQMPRESMSLFSAISRICKTAHLLAITTNPRGMVRLADDAGISADKRTILSVPQSEVPGLLAAGDCGLLLREASIVNLVASPVKFAEYLAVGLPVVITEGIGDYSELVKSEGIGVVLPPVNRGGNMSIGREQIEKLTSLDRNKIRSIALRELDWGQMTYPALLTDLVKAQAGISTR